MKATCQAAIYAVFAYMQCRHMPCQRARPGIHILDKCNWGLGVEIGTLHPWDEELLRKVKGADHPDLELMRVGKIARARKDLLLRRSESQRGSYRLAS